jgi:hypothetical protein
MHAAATPPPSGQFHLGEMHGHGTLQLAPGHRYTGAFRRNQFEGRGRLELPDGSALEGKFVNHRLNGPGRATTAAGEEYEGEFVGGARCGRGRCCFADGSVYKVHPCMAGARQGARTGAEPRLESSGRRLMGGVHGFMRTPALQDMMNANYTEPCLACCLPAPVHQPRAHHSPAGHVCERQAPRRGHTGSCFPSRLDLRGAVHLRPA